MKAVSVQEETSRDEYVSFMVFEAKRGAPSEGLGLKFFRIAPRTGEYIGTNDAKGNGQIYKVIAVMHPLEIAHTAGDLIVEYVDTDFDFRTKMNFGNEL